MKQLIIALALSVAVSGQQTAPWFGVPLPSGLGDPHRPVVDVASVRAPAATVPAGESQHNELEGARILRDVAAVVEFSKKSRAAGDRVWGRVTGLPAAADTAAWIAKQFTAAGLTNVQVQTYDATAPMWWSRGWEARLLADPAFGAGSRDVVLESALPTGGSRIDGAIVGDLVLAGSTTDPLPTIDVKNTIAVQTLRPGSGAYSERGGTVARAKELISKGALAVINVVEQTANMHVRDFGNCGGPCFNIGTADGAFVRQVIERAKARDGSRAVKIRLSLQSEMLANLKGQNVVGILSGKSSENVIVNAHMDGWFDAAGDNADGVGVLLALARHFANPAHRPERTLVFVASGGHHSTGLNGPGSFVKMNAELTKGTALVLNLEHVAQFAIPSASWRVEPQEQVMSFGISNEAPFLTELGHKAAERYGFRINPTFTASVPGDLGGYAPLNVARVQAIHSGPMYHTSGDVLETISTAGLERAARFFAYFVHEVAKAPRASLQK